MGDSNAGPAMIDLQGSSGGSSARRLLTALARESDLVVVAQVASTTAVPSGPHGLPGIHTAVSLTEVDYLRGSAAADFWVQGGTLGKHARRVAGQATFRAGERVLLFLRRGPDGSLWPTRMTLGKWMLAEGDLGALAVLESNAATSVALDQVPSLVAKAAAE